MSDAYGRKAFADECRGLRAVTDDRNNAFNTCAFKCWQLVAGGHLNADELTKLEDIALEIGLDHAEVRATMDSARRGGEQTPRGGNGTAPEYSRPTPKKDEVDEQARAREWTASIIKASRKLGGHPYLAKKRIQAPETLHVINAATVREITGWTPKGKKGELQGPLIVAGLTRPGEDAPCQVQLIDGEGRKAFLPGQGTLRGAFCALNTPGKPSCIIIGEGIATTKSGIDAIPGAMGLVAMASVNLVRTAEAARAMHPDAEIIVLADLERKTGEPDKHALDAARAVRGRCAIPFFGPARDESQTDFNDMAQASKKGAVAECIRSARIIEPEQTPDPGQTGTDRDNAGTTPGQKSRFRIYTHENIDTLPDTTWTVKNILPDIGMGALHGESTVGKSFLALDLAAAITEGRSWFGHRVRQRPVAYLVLEGIGGFKQRLRAYEIRHGRKCPNEQLQIIEVEDESFFDIRDPKHCAELAASLPQDCIVIVDTLAQAAPGSNENTSEDGGKTLLGARIIMGKSRFVLFVAHSGKDPTKGIRGWSGIFAALDTNLEVTSTPGGTGYVWTAKKIKDGQCGIQGPFKRDIVELGEDADGDAITSCVIRPDESVRAEAAPREKLNAVMQTGMKSFESCIREHGGGGVWLDDWRKHFYAADTAENEDTKRKNFNRARRDLENRGHLQVHNDFYTRAGAGQIGTTPGQSRDKF